MVPNYLCLMKISDWDVLYRAILTKQSDFEIYRPAFEGSSGGKLFGRNPRQTSCEK